MIAIVGAGISGLTSALTLQKLGHKIIIIDKGRSVGGRLATRYFESCGVKRYIDTASHYIELNDETPQMKSLLLSLYPEQASNKVLQGTTGINSIAQMLSEQLHNVQIVLSHKVRSLTYDCKSQQFQLRATGQQGEQALTVDGVVLTAPVPQSIDLLAQFPDVVRRLRSAPTYHRCLLLLLWPKTSMSVDALQKPEYIDRIVAQKHIAANTEPMPIAVHASYEWSDRHYDSTDEQIMDLLIQDTAIERDNFDCIQVKRWGQAQPMSAAIHNAIGYVLEENTNLVVCSDALGLGNIHHAGEAGIHAASELSERLHILRPARM